MKRANYDRYCTKHGVKLQPLFTSFFCPSCDNEGATTEFDRDETTQKIEWKKRFG